jgi:hypothetical protein
MASFNKFRAFVEAIAHGKHNLSTANLKYALCNADNAPVNTNSVLANITPISYANIDDDQALTTSASSQTAGLYTLKITDKVITATGAVATFRYIVLYNDSATNKDLIGWYDYGSDVTMASGDSFTIDFDGTDGVLTIE